MSKIFKYDLFISYASPNKEIAMYVVDKLEKRSLHCFIAPRDILGGNNYASEIVNAISNSCAMLLIFSEDSNNSGYVLREVNSAVARNKTIIPLRIQDFLPSEAMEFYLGPTQWLDAYPKILDIHLDTVLSIYYSIKNKDSAFKEMIKVKGPELIENKELIKLGYSNQIITMKEIELDYLCIDKDKHIINESIEGTMDDWISVTNEFSDTGCVLIINDEIVGYTYILPITDNDYQNVLDGNQMIGQNMVDIYCFGGEFNAYVTMIAIDPDHATQENYSLFIKWIYKKIELWKEQNIIIKNIGISVYSNLLKKILIKLGFSFKGFNLAKGEIFECNALELLNQKLFK